MLALDSGVYGGFFLGAAPPRIGRSASVQAPIQPGLPMLGAMPHRPAAIAAPAPDSQSNSPGLSPIREYSTKRRKRSRLSVEAMGSVVPMHSVFFRRTNVASVPEYNLDIPAGQPREKPGTQTRQFNNVIRGHTKLGYDV